MQGTASGLREDLEAGLAGLERRAPEWRAWLELLRATVRAGAEPGWDDALAPDQPGSERAPGTPLLQGRTLELDDRRVQDLVQRIGIALGERSALGSYRPSSSESLELLSAALRQDAAALERLAETAGVDPGGLGAVAHLVAWPLLQACGRCLRERIPSDWQQGFCPVCGAWPTVAELRGLERTRWLRCGWCAAGWPLPWLWCPFCGEHRHDRLGCLVPEARQDSRKVDTCLECRGYLKSLTTLEAMTPVAVLLADLETVELDLVARERGWLRPLGPGHALELRIVARGGDRMGESQ
jgi:FdhE protein